MKQPFRTFGGRFAGCASPPSRPAYGDFSRFGWLGEEDDAYSGMAALDRPLTARVRWAGNEDVKAVPNILRPWSMAALPSFRPPSSSLWTDEISKCPARPLHSMSTLQLPNHSWIHLWIGFLESSHPQTFDRLAVSARRIVQDVRLTRQPDWNCTNGTEG